MGTACQAGFAGWWSGSSIGSAVNIVFDREPGLSAAHIGIAMISIIPRRLTVAQVQAQQGI
jgi:hypothetical protein